MNQETYKSIQKLARKIKRELSDEEILLLIRILSEKDLARFSEHKDSTAYGNYAHVTKVCIACGRPI